jgi:carbon storage regulator CsrA
MLTMLVLSRRIDEAIVFPGLNITVRLLQIRGGGVRLGIDAPPEVAVLREELLGPAAVAPSVVPHARP